MSEKFTQRDFNEEMFYAIYRSVLAESTTISQLLQSALNTLEEQGYDIPEYEETWEGGVEFDDNPELTRRVDSFTKRFQKLTGYNFE